jgi:hypothetical protein
MSLSIAMRSLTDFVNIKINSIQSFECVYRGRLCVWVSVRTYMSICIYNILKIYTGSDSTQQSLQVHVTDFPFFTFLLSFNHFIIVKMLPL